VTENEIIGKISDYRINNNRQWMKLLEIAVRADPESAKLVLRAINKNDRKVSALLEKLAK